MNSLYLEWRDAQRRKMDVAAVSSKLSRLDRRFYERPIIRALRLVMGSL